MACCPSSSVIAAGTKSGHAYFIEATTVENPKILSSILLHKGSLFHLWLVFSCKGEVMLSS